MKGTMGVSSEARMLVILGLRMSSGAYLEEHVLFLCGLCIPS